MELKLAERFIAYARKHDMFHPGAQVVVAVSGGIDSVVLLDLFLKIAAEWRLGLTAAHFNHQLRGAEAERDEAFVRGLCAERGIACVTGRGDVQMHAQQSHLSLEMAARELRYDFLRRTAEQCDSPVIATAHHAGDQAETVLDHLIRGAGMRGLAGISPVSAIGQAPTLLIRPLLFASRAEIVAYAALEKLAYCDDSTNRSLHIRRNSIRHTLLPLLQKFNPRIESALCHCAEHVREVELFAHQESERALQGCLMREEPGKIILDKKSFLSYFTILQKYMLQDLWHRLGGDIRQLNQGFWASFEAFTAAGRADRALTVKGGEVWLTDRHLVLLRKLPAAAKKELSAPPGQYPLWDGNSLEIKAVSLPLEVIEKNSDPGTVWVDADRLQGELYVRSLKPGDRMRLLGLSGRKKIADLLAEAGVPVYERKRIPLLFCGDEVVWVCGIRLSDLFRVTPATSHIFQMKVETSLGTTIRV